MGKTKWIAKIAAIALLGGALGYYNFVDKAAVSLVEVGKECPNFIAKPYDISGETFTPSNDVYTLVGQKGKVCVVNFWETWCAACIAELHEFDQIQKDYEGRVEVVAIVGADVSRTTENGAAWLNSKGWETHDPNNDWATFDLTFAYLPSDTCRELGAIDALPRTVIVDQEGEVVFAQDSTMTYESLKKIIDEHL